MPITKRFNVKSEQQLNRVEADWRKHAFSADDWIEFQKRIPGFDPNNAIEVTRVSATELLIVTTGGNRLTFKVKA